MELLEKLLEKYQVKFLVGALFNLLDISQMEFLMKFRAEFVENEFKMQDEYQVEHRKRIPGCIVQISFAKLNISDNLRE